MCFLAHQIGCAIPATLGRIFFLGYFSDLKLACDLDWILATFYWPLLLGPGWPFAIFRHELSRALDWPLNIFDYQRFCTSCIGLLNPLLRIYFYRTHSSVLSPRTSYIVS